MSNPERHLPEEALEPREMPMTDAAGAPEAIANTNPLIQPDVPIEYANMSGVPKEYTMIPGLPNRRPLGPEYAYAVRRDTKKRWEKSEALWERLNAAGYSREALQTAAIGLARRIADGRASRQGMPSDAEYDGQAEQVDLTDLVMIVVRMQRLSPKEHKGTPEEVAEGFIATLA